jgi:hypothetical protein
MHCFNTASNARDAFLRRVGDSVLQPLNALDLQLQKFDSDVMNKELSLKVWDDAFNKLTNDLENAIDNTSATLEALVDPLKTIFCFSEVYVH